MIDITKLEKIQCDCAISIGKNCQIADALRRNNLRFFASPFDWMTSYTLDDWLYYVKNKGKNFFKKYSICPEQMVVNCYSIKDYDTETLSIHDFSVKLPIFVSSVLFQIKYKKRFKKLTRVLKNAKNLCLISSRNINIKEICEFLDEFSKIYQYDNLYLINVYNSEKEEIVKYTLKSATVYMIYFNDSEILDKKDCWKGNIPYWDKVLSKISLNQDFVKKYSVKKIYFKLKKTFIVCNLYFKKIL